MAEPVRKHFGRKTGQAEWRELKEREHKAVVRVFLFQAKSPEMLSANDNLADLNFVDTLFIRKGPGPSANQLMPIGGQVAEHEPIDAAARREALEETHLRPIPKTMVGLRTVQNYTFNHSTDRHAKPSNKQRRAYFFAANLLPAPHDVPYVLDKVEDKIDNFEHLNPEQLADLLQSGQITTDHGPATMLDSLQLDEANRVARGTHTEQDTVTGLHTELLIHFALREAEKKLNVLIALISTSHVVVRGSVTETASRLLLHVQQLLYGANSDFTGKSLADAQTMISTVRTLWQGQVAEHPDWTIERIRQALEASNMRDTLANAVEHYHFQSGSGVPTINLITPLLLTGKIDKTKYRVLETNAQALQLLEVTQVLHHYQQMRRAEDPKRSQLAERALRRRLQLEADAVIDVTAIRQWLQRKDILNQEITAEYDDLAAGIDGYFEALQREAHITDFSIDQVNEVKGASFEQLVDLSFGADDGAKTRRPDYRRQVQWEAQRKLLLSLMLHETNAYRKEIFRRGIQPLNDLEQTLESPDSIANQRVLQLAGVDHPVRIELRVKSLMSHLRKLIVRDRMSASVGDDTYAEAIIFNGPEADYREIAYQPSGVVTNEDNQVAPVIMAPAVVVDFMESLFTKAKERGEHIRINKFKGLPEPGSGFQSSGAGGGADVRMVKFYIRHIDAKSVHRMREVQMFVPNVEMEVDEETQVETPVWRSGVFYYEQKKQDDQDYALRRLFSTKALRSFMELLYPAEIYGDTLQPIYSARVKTASANKPGKVKA